MLTISTAGNQTTWDTPENINVQVPLSVTIVETDQTLKTQEITASVAWGNGVPSAYTATGGTLAPQTTVSLSPGQYFVRISAKNARFPVPDFASAVLPITVNQINAPPAPLQYVYGPILPSDTGFPNNSQWSFNRGADLEILESSAKMLLSTAKGERKNNPNYGTNLRRIIFSQNTASVQNDIQNEIVTALAAFEPRLTLQSARVVLPNAADQSTVAVLVSLVSNITGSQIALALPFSAG